jgi:IclR family transcriptional regulator, blcABC operon repressor
VERSGARATREQVEDVTLEPNGDGHEDGASLAPAVTRAAMLLGVLAENAGEPAGPSELARRIGIPKSSVANICAALADAGFVRRIGTGFALGRRLAELGGAYLSTVDQVQEFYEASRQLPNGTDETVQFAVLEGLEVTYLARHDGRQQIRLTSGIGRRLPAVTTATGKAALASLDDVELDRRLAALASLPRATPNAHHTVAELRADLDEVRRRGYAIDNEENVEGVVCYGVVIPSRQPGDGPYAASITLLKARATPDRVPGIVEDLRWLAAELSDPIRRIDRDDGRRQSASSRRA